MYRRENCILKRDFPGGLIKFQILRQAIENKMVGGIDGELLQTIHTELTWE